MGVQHNDGRVGSTLEGVVARVTKINDGSSPTGLDKILPIGLLRFHEDYRNRLKIAQNHRIISLLLQ